MFWNWSSEFSVANIPDPRGAKCKVGTRMEAIECRHELMDTEAKGLVGLDYGASLLTITG